MKREREREREREKEGRGRKGEGERERLNVKPVVFFLSRFDRMHHAICQLYQAPSSDDFFKKQKKTKIQTRENITK
jgi:hypothetical protein